ncbi:hypothetical protein PPERSA_07059 [Pseudocohnilembus persalinus]|uniref:Atg6 BARA domain-containing protein n=1 Tax=Pseudocohnilembus persalinus TaxID=266149 RepID=A0A0V0QB39_PSEPJ|nr:hypothetical protein PPERSA_07059 [Pseudocohnilembus persalinus]|eukprot:KRW99287.1 hypothetical protein PPERSA_07059 [Pseudocohnilembus persalinus]
MSDQLQQQPEKENQDIQKIENVEQFIEEQLEHNSPNSPQSGQNLMKKQENQQQNDLEKVGNLGGIKLEKIENQEENNINEQDDQIEQFEQQIQQSVPDFQIQNKQNQNQSENQNQKENKTDVQNQSQKEAFIFLCSYCQEQADYDHNQLTEQQKEFFCCETCLENEIKMEEEKFQTLNSTIKIYHSKFEKMDTDIEEAQKLLEQYSAEELENQEKVIDEQMENQQKILEEQTLELNKLKNEVVNLETKESEYWRKINNHQKNLVKLEEKFQRANSYLNKLNQDIENIKKINVVNDVFHIFTDEQAGTVNGLTIGKKNDQKQIDWDITNAGLGQICVLVTYLKQKFKFNYRNIEYITCNGNYSTIKLKSLITTSQGIKKAKQIDLNLYGPLPKKENEENFNLGVYHLLNEFSYFVKFLQQQESIRSKQIFIQLPYEIEADGLKQADNFYSLNSLAYKENKWDGWTQAFKFFLADLKYIISINSKYDQKAEEEYIKAIQ